MEIDTGDDMIIANMINILNERQPSFQFKNEITSKAFNVTQKEDMSSQFKKGVLCLMTACEMLYSELWNNLYTSIGENNFWIKYKFYLKGGTSLYLLYHAMNQSNEIRNVVNKYISNHKVSDWDSSFIFNPNISAEDYLKLTEKILQSFISIMDNDSKGSFSYMDYVLTHNNDFKLNFEKSEFEKIIESMDISNDKKQFIKNNMAHIKTITAKPVKQNNIVNYYGFSYSNITNDSYDANYAMSPFGNELQKKIFETIGKMNIVSSGNINNSYGKNTDVTSYNYNMNPLHVNYTGDSTYFFYNLNSISKSNRRTSDTLYWKDWYDLYRLQIHYTVEIKFINDQSLTFYSSCELIDLSIPCIFWGLNNIKYISVEVSHFYHISPYDLIPFHSGNKPVSIYPNGGILSYPVSNAKLLIKDIIKTINDCIIAQDAKLSKRCDRLMDLLRIYIASLYPIEGFINSIDLRCIFSCSQFIDTITIRQDQSLDCSRLYNNLLEQLAQSNEININVYNKIADSHQNIMYFYGLLTKYNNYFKDSILAADYNQIGGITCMGKLRYEYDKLFSIINNTMGMQFGDVSTHPYVQYMNDTLHYNLYLSVCMFFNSTIENVRRNTKNIHILYPLEDDAICKSPYIFLNGFLKNIYTFNEEREFFHTLRTNIIDPHITSLDGLLFNALNTEYENKNLKYYHSGGIITELLYKFQNPYLPLPTELFSPDYDIHIYEWNDISYNNIYNAIQNFCDIKCDPSIVGYNREYITPHYKLRYELIGNTELIELSNQDSLSLDLILTSDIEREHIRHNLNRDTCFSMSLLLTEQMRNVRLNIVVKVSIEFFALGAPSLIYTYYKVIHLCEFIFFESFDQELVTGKYLPVNIPIGPIGMGKNIIIMNPYRTLIGVCSNIPKRLNSYKIIKLLNDVTRFNYMMNNYELLVEQLKEPLRSLLSSKTNPEIRNDMSLKVIELCQSVENKLHTTCSFQLLYENIIRLIDDIRDKCHKIIFNVGIEYPRGGTNKESLYYNNYIKYKTKYLQLKKLKS